MSERFAKASRLTGLHDVSSVMAPLLFQAQRSMCMSSVYVASPPIAPHAAHAVLSLHASRMRLASTCVQAAAITRKWNRLWLCSA